MALVLIAEDDDDIRFIVVRVLERAGHEVVAVTDGQQGLDAMRRRRPDVVVTDLDMPHLTGGEMCRRAAEEGLIHDVPIVVISGSLQPGDERIGAMGAAQALRKPFVGGELLACLAAVLPPDR